MPGFSLKWMLAGVAYVAVGAGACGQSTQTLASAFAALTGLILFYALLAALLWRGRRQALAVGFVLLACAYLAVLWRAPAVVPTRAAVLWISGEEPLSEAALLDIEQDLEQLRWQSRVASQAANKDYRARTAVGIAAREAAMLRRMAAGGYVAARIVVAHSLAALMLGLLGAGMGLHAYNRRGPAPDGADGE